MQPNSQTFHPQYNSYLLHSQRNQQNSTVVGTQQLTGTIGAPGHGPMSLVHEHAQSSPNLWLSTPLVDMRRTSIHVHLNGNLQVNALAHPTTTSDTAQVLHSQVPDKVGRNDTQSSYIDLQKMYANLAREKCLLSSALDSCPNFVLKNRAIELTKKIDSEMTKIGQAIRQKMNNGTSQPTRSDPPFINETSADDISVDWSEINEEIDDIEGASLVEALSDWFEQPASSDAPNLKGNSVISLPTDHLAKSSHSR